MKQFSGKLVIVGGVAGGASAAAKVRLITEFLFSFFEISFS